MVVCIFTVKAFDDLASRVHFAGESAHFEYAVPEQDFLDFRVVELFNVAGEAATLIGFEFDLDVLPGLACLENIDKSA